MQKLNLCCGDSRVAEIDSFRKAAVLNVLGVFAACFTKLWKETAELCPS